jgi:serine/threonine protein kinase
MQPKKPQEDIFVQKFAYYSAYVMSEDAVPPAPKTLGRYEIVRSLGRGAMGEVLEGRHVDLGTRAAIKILHADVARDTGAARRMLREGRAAARIGHPNVVKVLDVGIEEGRPFLVMDFLEGEDLAQYLTRCAPLRADQTADLLLPVAAAVAAAHDAGILHRDLKPSNVFLARRHGGTEPTVVDFGICKPLDETGGLASSTMNAAGTPLYMAPERFRSRFEGTPESDQYALGVIVYECLTGGTPFFEEHLYDLLRSIMTQDAVAPSEIVPALSPKLDAFVLRAIHREPQERFPSVRAFGASLLPFASPEAQRRWAAELVEETSQTAAISSRTLPPLPPRRHPARRRLMVVLTLAAVLPAAGIGLWLSAHRRAQRPELRFVPSATRAELVPASGPAPSEAPKELPATLTLPPDATPKAASPVANPARSVRRAPNPATTASVAPVDSRYSLPPLPLAGEPSAEPAVAPIERGTRNIPIVE